MGLRAPASNPMVGSSDHLISIKKSPLLLSCLENSKGLRCYMPEMGTKTKYPFLPMNRHIAECRWSLGVSDRNSRAGSSGQVLGGGEGVGLFAQDHVCSFSIKGAMLFWGF